MSTRVLNSRRIEMTRVTEHKRWRCNTCNRVSLETELLTAPSPFDPEDTLTGCPLCKGCDEGFEELCDEPNCMQQATGGWPTNDDSDQWGGYRRTCFKHSKWNKDEPQQ